jgi:hypothetical protein
MRTDHFRVTEAREVSFFGHAEPVSVIEGTLSDANVEYFFSSTRGLIGIKVSSPSVHSTLLSASLCGFAADNCKPTTCVFPDRFSTGRPGCMRTDFATMIPQWAAIQPVIPLA